MEQKGLSRINSLFFHMMHVIEVWSGSQTEQDVTFCARNTVLRYGKEFTPLCEYLWVSRTAWVQHVITSRRNSFGRLY